MTFYEQDVTETGFVAGLRWKRGKSTQLGPSDKVNKSFYQTLCFKTFIKGHNLPYFILLSIF